MRKILVFLTIASFAILSFGFTTKFNAKKRCGPTISILNNTIAGFGTSATISRYELTSPYENYRQADVTILSGGSHWVGGSNMGLHFMRIRLFRPFSGVFKVQDEYTGEIIASTSFVNAVEVDIVDADLRGCGHFNFILTKN